MRWINEWASAAKEHEEDTTNQSASRAGHIFSSFLLLLIESERRARPDRNS